MREGKGVKARNLLFGVRTFLLTSAISKQLHQNMEQPNFRIFSESIASASQEISRLPNLPTLMQDRTLITKVEGLETTI